jgi:hypothetical protein
MPHDHEGSPSQRDEGSLTWRFSLVDPETDERRGFPDLEALVAHLRVQMEGRVPDEAQDLDQPHDRVGLAGEFQCRPVH